MLDSTVVRAHAHAAGARRTAGEQRLLEWQEDADVAGRGVERADKGDDEQRPEAVEGCKAQSGQGHQQACGQQQRARRPPHSDDSDGQGQQRRPEQRGGG
jgi:hypothetical protein